jgi:hypothetical protein
MAISLKPMSKFIDLIFIFIVVSILDTSRASAGRPKRKVPVGDQEKREKRVNGFQACGWAVPSPLDVFLTCRKP